MNSPIKEQTKSTMKRSRTFRKRSIKRPIVRPIINTPMRKYANPTSRGPLANAIVIKFAIDAMIPATA